MSKYTLQGLANGTQTMPVTASPLIKAGKAKQVSLTVHPDDEREIKHFAKCLKMKRARQEKLNANTPT